MDQPQELFQFEIITPQITKTIMVEWVEIESPNGSFLVGPNHSPLVSLIKNQSTITYKQTDHEPYFYTATQGIFKVSNNKAIALLDQ